MPRAGPRKLYKYSKDFKLTAVRLSQQPGLQVQVVAAAQDHYDYTDGRGHANRINLNPSVESVGWPGFSGDAQKRTVWSKVLAAAEDRPVSRVARSSKGGRR